MSTFNYIYHLYHLLGRYYRKAYKRNIALKLFETKKGAAARRQVKQDKNGNVELIDTVDDIPLEEDEEEESKAQESAGMFVYCILWKVYNTSPLYLPSSFIIISLPSLY